MGNTIDITNYSDNVIDAILAFRTNDNSFDWESLTVKELYQLQDATGADFSVWIRQTEMRTARSTRPVGRDYEGAILARQERNSYAD